MDIGKSFSLLVASRWSDILLLNPLQRAERFVVPLEDDLGRATQAKELIAALVVGRETTAGVRWKYSGTDETKAACFNLAAAFYHSCFCGARDMMQAQAPSIAETWPCVEFSYFKKCHDTCRSLKKKRLPRTNSVVRTFYPPWHFGCDSRVEDSGEKPSRDFTLSIKTESLQYFHNPIDVLVSQGLVNDFPGVDFGDHAVKCYDLSNISVC